MTAERSVRDRQREASAATNPLARVPELERRRLLREGWSEGLCMCGCGQETSTAKGYANGMKPGEHYRYVRGHAARHRAAMRRAGQEREGAIPLGGGLYALVDEESRAWLSRWSWGARPNGGRVYAARNASAEEKAGGSAWLIFMHREIMGLGRGSNPQVDHRSGDGLDNRRANLRLAAPAQNHTNRPGRRATSAYKGVHWASWANRWRVKLTARDGSSIHVGYFADEVRAARAHDAAAVAEHGEFAWLNFPGNEAR